MVDTDVPDELPLLSISVEKVCFVAAMAREFDVEEDEEDESGADATEEHFVRALAEEESPDPVEDEFIAFVDEMTEDEQIDLVALAWLGRGDGAIEDWDDLRRQAADAHNKRTAAYLLGIPLLPDYLEDGLAAFGRSCEDADNKRP
jgi:Protein of unknown function (DUF3775)